MTFNINCIRNLWSAKQKLMLKTISVKRFRLGDKNNTEPGVIISSNLKLKSSDKFMWIGSDLDKEYWHIGCNLQNIATFDF